MKAAAKVASEIADILEKVPQTPGEAYPLVPKTTLQRWLVWLAPPKRRRIRPRDPLPGASRVPTLRELDALCRKIVFARDDGMCQWFNPADPLKQVCGQIHGLMDWAHIISRRHHGTRWELGNSIVLCRKHHMLWHDEPVLAGAWYMVKRGRQAYEALVERSRLTRVDKYGVRTFLRKMAREYGVEVK